MIINLIKIFLNVIILMFLSSNLFSEEFCRLNIFETYQKKNITCSKNQSILGILKFNTMTRNYPFDFNPGLNIHIPKTFKKEVLNFIENLCNKKKVIRLKTITNFDKNNESFTNKLLVSCKKK
tara:strand:+ start:3418 stop:3786 length:369 start_codon:yes stop_codon:yes gene_type:complete